MVGLLLFGGGCFFDYPLCHVIKFQHNHWELLLSQSQRLLLSRIPESMIFSVCIEEAVFGRLMLNVCLLFSPQVLNIVLCHDAVLWIQNLFFCKESLPG